MTSAGESRNVSRAAGERDELLELLAILWKARWRILVSAGLCALLGFGIASFLRPVYRGEAVIAQASDDRGAGGLASLAGQFGGLANLVGVNLDAANGSEPLGILRSRALAERFMRELAITGVIAGDPDDGSSQVERVSGKAYERFRKKVRKILEDQESGLIVVRFEWFDRDKVADWANQYVSLANRVIQERAISQSDLRLEYLNKAVDEATSVDLRQALFNLIESEVKSRMLASIDTEIAFRVIDPAVRPLEDDIARPNRVLITVISFLAGLFLAIAASYVIGIVRERSLSSPPS